jgi:hypothetical protein
VRKTGLAQLHKGELVLTKKKGQAASKKATREADHHYSGVKLKLFFLFGCVFSFRFDGDIYFGTFL